MVPVNDIAVQQQVTAHDLRNRQLLASLAAEGVDLHAKRRVDVYFYAVSEACALELVTVLKARGFHDVRAREASGTVPKWFVEAGAQATPQEVGATEYTQSLVRLAFAHGAEYDGWGTEV